LHNKKQFDQAINKYKEGEEKLNKELSKIHKEKEYNPQSKELLSLSTKILSNLSTCYTKTERYQESVDLDLRIISEDPNFDKAYVRLFQNYLKLDKSEQALYYGKLLLKFDEETQKKYPEIIEEINKLEKQLKAEEEVKKAKKRKETCKNIIKYAFPIFLLLIAVGVYYIVFNKKKVK
jgi:tetratricopeptide (TPR) repeat protein